MLKIHFTDDFLFDVSEIVVWYENIRFGLSHDFELCLESGIEDIKKFPEAFQKRHEDVKIRFIDCLSYGIHYVIKNDVIYVIAVFHTSLKPTNWSKRSNKF